MSDPVPATTRALQVTEVALEILSHLDCSSLSRMSLVNRKFKALAECELYTHPGLYDPNDKFEGYREEYQAHRQRLMRVIGTIQTRTELALKVRKVDLVVVQNVDQVNSDLSYAQPIASLLQLTKKLRYVKLRGDSDATLARTIPLLAVYASNISALTIDQHVMSDESESFHFSSIGPYLAAFVNLQVLTLDDIRLTSNDTAGWPKPSFRLTELTLAVNCRASPGTISTADSDWLIGSSRQSLEHLTLGDYNRDLVVNIIDTSYNLRSLCFRVDVEATELDAGMMTKMATRAQPVQLDLIVDQAKRDVALGWMAMGAQVNQRVDAALSVFVS